MHPTSDSQELEVDISRGGGRSDFLLGSFVSKSVEKRRNVELTTGFGRTHMEVIVARIGYS